MFSIVLNSRRVNPGDNTKKSSCFINKVINTGVTPHIYVGANGLIYQNTTTTSVPNPSCLINSSTQTILKNDAYKSLTTNTKWGITKTI